MIEFQLGSKKEKETEKKGKEEEKGKRNGKVTSSVRERTRRDDTLVASVCAC